MANQDIPNGFRPWGRCLRINEYEADTTIYKGDLLKLKSDGQVEPCAAGTTAAIGVAMNYAVAGEKVLVADDPDQLFEVQSDDATEPAAQTACGLNFNIVVGTASTRYRRSAMELDGDTGASVSNLPLKLMRVLPRAGNAFGANARVVVAINNHKLKSHDVGTLGV